jgi:hypothetical protein
MLSDRGYLHSTDCFQRHMNMVMTSRLPRCFWKEPPCGSYSLTGWWPSELSWSLLPAALNAPSAGTALQRITGPKVHVATSC